MWDRTNNRSQLKKQNLVEQFNMREPRMNETCQYVIRANDVVPYEQPPS